MLHDYLLYVFREHVHPARYDHVFLSVYQMKKSVRIREPDVTRMQPAVDDRLCREVWSFVIAGHEHRPSARYLTNFACGQFAAFGIHDSHFRERDWRTDRIDLLRKVV